MIGSGNELSHQIHAAKHASPATMNPTKLVDVHPQVPALPSP